MVVSTLLERKKQMKNIDPFLLLNKVTEQMKSITDSTSKLTLLKLRTLVLSKTEIYSYRHKLKQANWFTKMQQKTMGVKRTDFLHLKNLKFNRIARTDVVCQKRRRSRLVLK
jgi:hypothetical protein